MMEMVEKLHELEGLSVKQNNQGLNLGVKRREYCILHLFDKMPKLSGQCYNVVNQTWAVHDVLHTQSTFL